MAFLDNVGLRHLIARLGDLVGKRNGIAPLGDEAKVPQAHLPEMTGATSQRLGGGGIVPTPQAGDQVKFLKGNAKWSEINAANVSLHESVIDAQHTNLYTAMLYIKGQLPNIVYNTTDEGPSNPVEGMIWLKPKS